MNRRVHFRGPSWTFRSSPYENRTTACEGEGFLITVQTISMADVLPINESPPPELLGETLTYASIRGVLGMKQAGDSLIPSKTVG